MLRCPSCLEIYSSTSSCCSHCGQGQKVENGIIIWAPDIAYKNSGFKSEYFNPLVKVEAANFWFRARNALILWAIKKYSPLFNSFLEVGCGTGFVLSGIADAYPKAELMGSEVLLAGLEYARARLPRAKFVQMDARKIPYEDEFDVIGTFDVLEHIQEDEKALAEMYRAIKYGGLLIVTVPQHPFLWSAADEYACHVRRYTATEIHEKLEKVGFRIIRSTSFVSFLLPAIIISRMDSTDKNIFDPLKEFKINRVLNYLFSVIMFIERMFIQAGISFFAGGSRLIVAKKDII